MPLRAIAYVSQALPDLSAERLQALVDDAARFNKMAGVTGVLLHDGGRFLQYIEGPPDGIDSVYERILQAGSHVDIIELARGRLGQRQFPYWSMRALPVDAALLRQQRGMQIRRTGLNFATGMAASGPNMLRVVVNSSPTHQSPNSQ